MGQFPQDLELIGTPGTSSAPFSPPAPSLRRPLLTKRWLAGAGLYTITLSSAVLARHASGALLDYYLFGLVRLTAGRPKTIVQLRRSL